MCRYVVEANKFVSSCLKQKTAGKVGNTVSNKQELHPGPSTAGSGLGGTPPPSKDGPAKNLYSKSARLTVSCRVTWALHVRVNLYS